MANISHTGDRVTRWIRYIARALAMIWAGWWMYLGVASAFVEGLNLVEVLVRTTLPGLVFLVSAVIAWRWEAIGGVALVVESLLIFIAYPVMTYGSLPLSTVVFMLLTMGLPPLVAGSLFLVSRRRSKKSRMPQNST